MNDDTPIRAARDALLASRRYILAAIPSGSKSARDEASNTLMMVDSALDRLAATEPAEPPPLLSLRGGDDEKMDSLLADYAHGAYAIPKATLRRIARRVIRAVNEEIAGEQSRSASSLTESAAREPVAEVILCNEGPGQYVTASAPLTDAQRARAILVLLWRKYDAAGISMGRGYEAVLLEAAMELLGEADPADVRRLDAMPQGEFVDEVRSYLSAKKARSLGLRASTPSPSPTGEPK